MRLIRLILSRQIRVPFWKATPANAASPAVGITSRYKIPEKCPIDGITNAELSPKKIWQTKVAVTDAQHLGQETTVIQIFNDLLKNGTSILCLRARL